MYHNSFFLYYFVNVVGVISQTTVKIAWHLMPVVFYDIIVIADVFKYRDFGYRLTN